MMPDKQNEDLEELMTLARGVEGTIGDMYWQLMTDAAFAVGTYIQELENQVEELTERHDMKDMEPYVWPNMDEDPDCLDIEIIGEHGRFLLWFDEEGDAGYTFITDGPVAYYGYMTPKSLEALKDRLNRGNLGLPSREKKHE